MVKHLLLGTALFLCQGCTTLNSGALSLDSTSSPYNPMTIDGVDANKFKIRPSAGDQKDQNLTWGAEDDEALMRLKNKQAWYTKTNKGPVHLGHAKNLNDPYYHIPVYTDKYYEVNNVKFGRRYDS